LFFKLLSLVFQLNFLYSITLKILSIEIFVPMKTLLYSFVCCCSFLFSFAQEPTESVDRPLGYRLKRNVVDEIIYKDNGLKPDFTNYRKLNYRVYFRKVNYPVATIDGKKYQLITIPGAKRQLPQNEDEKAKLGAGEALLVGSLIDKDDYDQNFWIEEGQIQTNTDTEYYKYANDVSFGVLTAPFKYRLKAGNAPQSILDGDFNLESYLGWKWRLSSSKPYYIVPFGFAGVTSLKYNSDNNTGITEGNGEENGTGITYGAGISVRLGDVSPGFIIGWDHGLGTLGSTFIYSDKPWISFSVNYDFFKPKKTEETQVEK